jgi:hypothetical protein
MRGQKLGRRRARRLCRSFACVGVDTSPRRLQAILAGAPAGDVELTDVNFALIATKFNDEKRGARLKDLKRRGARSLIFAALFLVMLNFLFCMAYVLLNLTQQAPM